MTQGDTKMAVWLLPTTPSLPLHRPNYSSFYSLLLLSYSYLYTTVMYNPQPTSTHCCDAVGPGSTILFR